MRRNIGLALVLGIACGTSFADESMARNGIVSAVCENAAEAVNRAIRSSLVITRTPP